MRKKPWIFGIDADPPRFVWCVPFIVLIVGYQLGSFYYLADNPGGRLLPSFMTMGQRLWTLAVVRDTLWIDTYASLYRILIGTTLASTAGLLFGMNMALFPTMRAMFLPFIKAVSNIPPMGFIAIIIILSGIGDFSKILLIFLGVVSVITLDMYLATSALATERLIKSRTLGASQLGYVYTIALPMVLPRLIETTRLSLGAAWVYLISSESLAASSGLGYRMYVVARQMDMATIYPYLLWIGLLAFVIDQALRITLQLACPWHSERGTVARALAMIPGIVSGRKQ